MKIAPSGFPNRLGEITSIEKKMNKFDLDGLRGSKITQLRPVSLRNSSRNRAFKLYRLATLLVLVLALFMALFAGQSSLPGSSQAALGQAAVATQPVKIQSNLPLALPDSKAEAQAFAAQHQSQFNFDTLNRLRLEKAVELGDVPASGLQSQSGNASILVAPSPALVQPGLTPLPTNASYSSNGNSGILAYTPANQTPGIPICGANPGEDIFEQDSAAATARDITAFLTPTFRETHTLTEISSNPSNSSAFDGDNDWVKLRLLANTSYTFSTANLKPNYPVSVNTVIELYRGTSTAAVTPVNANDDVSSSNPASNLTYTSVTGDNASGVFFYLRIYGKPNASCYGTYDLVISYTTLANPAATPTITSVADTCNDAYENDNTPDQAKELRVTYGITSPFDGLPGTPDVSSANNNVQAHLICPTADQDWVYFDLVKGKPYSLFTANLNNGLDTILILFQSNSSGVLNPLYASDDFPGMGLASRIDFIVPATTGTQTGEFTRYYAVVKDVTGNGLNNLSYKFVLQSPGNPKGDCIDNYEQDGVQADAKEILINEVQIHVICPDGDADWVKFYAKAGRTYSMKTAFPPSPGLDTVLRIFSVVFDPANPTLVVSQREIASNDDAAPPDLNSKVDFSVPVDGVYYAQVKNNGDVGRPGLTYSLTYSVAGGAATPPTVAPTTGGTRSTTTVALTATTASRVTATAAVSVTITASVNREVLALKFADPAFQKLWYYTDLAVTQNQTQRSWEWGPKPGVVLQEPYAQSPGGSRQVQYFDKSRMEINNPKGERTGSWFVSNGLLVKELITGQVAMGDNAFEQRNPARLQVAGDTTPDNPAPTYAMFDSLITNGPANRATDRTGQVVKQGLSAEGAVQALSTTPENLKLSAFIKETSHNVPQVFYDFMLGNGKVYENGYKEGQLRDWVFAMGYPISEPYWIKARVGGVEQDVLVQLFERRVLTYTPSNSPEWRIEMANVGQHYYFWRYGRSLLEE